MKRPFRPEWHWRQTQVRLLAGGWLILGVVGGGLVWLFYGQAAALTAISCFLAVAVVVCLLWLILAILERWVRDDEP